VCVISTYQSHKKMSLVFRFTTSETSLVVRVVDCPSEAAAKLLQKKPEFCGLFATLGKCVVRECFCWSDKPEEDYPVTVRYALFSPERTY